MPLKKYGELLAKYLGTQWPRVALLTVLLFGGIGLQLASPQVIRYFIDTAQSHGAQQSLLMAAMLFVAIALVSQVVRLATNYAVASIGWTATNALRADLTLHCLRLDMPFHKQHTPGELIERIDGDVTALANFFSQFILRVMGNALLVIGILALLFREDVRVGAGLTLYVLVTLLLLAVMQRHAVPRWAAGRQSSADLFGFMEERISGTEDIRASGAEPYMLNRLYRLMRAWLEKRRAAIVLSVLVVGMANVLYVISYAIGLAVGVYLYTYGAATIGTAYIIVYYIGKLSAPVQSIRSEVQDLQQATASILRINELFELRPQVQDKAGQPDSKVALAGPLSVELHNVSFGYEDNENVLDELSFQLQPGKVLGVLGRTGSGKTTITRLLFRLYDPASGVIRLNDVDMRDIPLAELRERVGMVTQDVQLFQATVRDNLTFFDHRISDTHIKAILREVGLWDWFQSLPGGLDTGLAASGQGLSAGEAQLLALTRVFLKNPGLVILDEASARLDPATEIWLERAVAQLLADRTGIVIAHRLRTVQRADDILILDSGRVVEYGSREDLASDPSSRFYHLLQTGLEAVLA